MQHYRQNPKNNNLHLPNGQISKRKEMIPKRLPRKTLPKTEKPQQEGAKVCEETSKDLGKLKITNWKDAKATVHQISTFPNANNILTQGIRMETV